MTQPFFQLFAIFNCSFYSALSLAMSRDGSSGGVIRMAVITEEGVERMFVPGDELPTFWQGREILGRANKPVDTIAPMVVEA
jgi:20S proteasome subunit beta 1